MFGRWNMVRGTIRGRADDFAALSIVGFILLIYSWIAVSNPYGNWDAWAIWNLRAKFLAFGPENTFNGALASYSHLDYPLLLPLLVAAGWRLLGYTVLVPIVVHGIIFVIIVFLFRKKSAWSFLLVALVVAQFAPYQYADTLLSLCLLLATVAYTAKKEATTGVALGFGALVKNEGMLVLLAFFAVWIIASRRIPWRAVIACVPFVLLLMAQKMLLAPPNDLLTAPGVTERLLNPARFLLVIYYMWLFILRFADGALFVLLFCMWSQRVRVFPSTPLVAVGLIFAAYLVIYVVTPYELEWHFQTSFHRLLLQLFPALVYILSPPHRAI